MKKLVLAGFLLAVILGAEAQNVASTTSLTSGGNLAGATGTTSTYFGANAGKVSTGTANTFVGHNTGLANITGANNVYLGRDSGIGYQGSNNTFTGKDAGNGNISSSSIPAGVQVTGSLNSFYGLSSGRNHGGTNNAFFGANSGLASSLNNVGSNGSNNTYIGSNSALRTTGSNNVFLGYSSGPSGNPSVLQAVSDKLYIDNSANNTPLIWGDFAADQLKLNGTVGIGAVTAFPLVNPLYANYKLFVTGGILTDEVRVALSSGGTWADYVFTKDYNLKPLSEVENFINANGHLPNVPSAKQVKEEGINVAEMATIQQEKIEELTLYIIAQNKRLEALEAKLNNK